MATRKEFVTMVGSETAAVEFENQALSIGAEFLPAHVQAVRDGAPPHPAYWAWLCEQLAKDVE